MDLRRNDSVMHVVFLCSRTRLMVTVKAAMHLVVKILFTFSSVQYVPCFFSFFKGLALLSADLS